MTIVRIVIDSLWPTVSLRLLGRKPGN